MRLVYSNCHEVCTKIKAIEIALRNEIGERDFYRRQSEKTENPLGKKMFATIAAEEDEHHAWPNRPIKTCRSPPTTGKP
ncbi:MAG: hypothetical protein GY866_09900 [Proteobacteria bacterium]|nr:hypothetical protein [Pseudomonadota bacterium]